MVDLLPYFTVGGIVITMTVGFFQIKASLQKRSQEQHEAIKNMINNSDHNIIDHIDSKLKVVEEKFRTTDTALSSNKDDIEDIEQDVKILEEDFKVLCQKIGKHDYVIDKILPEYLNLKDSIHNFKSVVNESLLSNKDENDTKT